MLSKLIGWFRFPVHDNIEQTQKAQFLYVTLLVTIGASRPDRFAESRGRYLHRHGPVRAGIISLICIPLSNRGYYTPVAIFISVLVLVMITLSMIEGIGMRDSGLLAYPVLIIFTSFLFGKEATVISTLASLASIELVYYLESTGRLSMPAFDMNIQLVVVSVMVIAIGLSMWIYKSNWERILKDLRDAYDLTLSGWGQALELRDQETEGHSQRAVELTLELAKTPGCPETGIGAHPAWGPAARHRQDGHPGCDPVETRPAVCRGVARDPPASGTGHPHAGKHPVFETGAGDSAQPS